MGKNQQVMLAHEYKEKKVDFPCYIQPKLDGIRCRAVIKDGDVTLWTRDGKPILSMDHIIEDLKHIKEEIELDGELYAHDIPFQEVNGIVRRQYHDERSKVVKYTLYDTIELNMGYTERLHKLERITDRYLSSSQYNVSLIPNYIAGSHDEVLLWHGNFTASGYEGAMVRTRIRDKKTKELVDVGYQSDFHTGNRRSWQLLKFKEFNDAEFKIVGMEEEYDLSGNPKGRLGAFIMQLDDGTERTFNASGISADIKEAAWQTPSDYIGKFATVKYFGVSQDGIPRFPNFVDIRWDNDVHS